MNLYFITVKSQSKQFNSHTANYVGEFPDVDGLVRVFRNDLERILGDIAAEEESGVDCDEIRLDSLVSARDSCENAIKIVSYAKRDEIEAFRLQPPAIDEEREILVHVAGVLIGKIDVLPLSVQVGPAVK